MGIEIIKSGFFYLTKDLSTGKVAAKAVHTVSELKDGNNVEIVFLVKNTDDVAHQLKNGTINLDGDNAFYNSQGLIWNPISIEAGEEIILCYPAKLNKDLEAGNINLPLKFIENIEGENKEVLVDSNISVFSDVQSITEEEKAGTEELLTTWGKKTPKVLQAWTGNTNGDVNEPEESSSKSNQSNESSSQKDQESKNSSSKNDEQSSKDKANNDQNTEKKPEEGMEMDFENIGGGTYVNTDVGGGTGGVSVQNKPKLIISNYKLNPEMPKAGEEFTMSLTFYNTNDDKSVRNIKISLNGQERTSGAQGQPASGSVFTPVNSSNTFFIDYIAPDEADSKTITLKAVPNATAQNYTMTVKFEYEDSDGNEFTAEEIIGIPVVQKAEILTGQIQKLTGAVGMPVPLELDFYNTGKDSLTNMMVTLEGDGFTTENQRYFVGNFAPGASDKFSSEIVATSPGNINGKVVITFEDSTGAVNKKEVPFEVEVEEFNMNEIMGSMEEMPMDKEDKGGSFTLPIIIAILALVAGIGYAMYRKKKKSKQAEDLDIDEN